MRAPPDSTTNNCTLPPPFNVAPIELVRLTAPQMVRAEVNVISTAISMRAPSVFADDKLEKLATVALGSGVGTGDGLDVTVGNGVNVVGAVVGAEVGNGDGNGDNVGAGVGDGPTQISNPLSTAPPSLLKVTIDSSVTTTPSGPVAPQ